MAEVYDPAVDRMRRQLREKALAELEAKSADLDATGASLNPEVANYVAKRNNLPLRMPEMTVTGRTPQAMERELRPAPSLAPPPIPEPDEGALANEYADRAGLVGGLGRGASKIAAAISGRKADTSAWDSIGQTAESRRAAVMDYMRKKTLGKEEHGRDLEKIGAQQKGNLELEDRRHGNDMTEKKYQAGEEWRRLQAQLGAEKEKAKAAGDEKKAKEIQDLQNKLAQDYLGNQQTKEVQGLEGAFAQIRGAPEDGTADATIIYGMAKMLDPSGKVTDGDVEMQGRKGELAPFLQAAFNAVKSGGSLGGGVRQQMKAEAERIYLAKTATHKPLQESFRTRATAGGADPSMVVPDLGFGGAAGGGAGAAKQQVATNPKTGESLPVSSPAEAAAFERRGWSIR